MNSGDFSYLLNIPKVSEEAICIADNPKLAAIISTYFTNQEEYFCILESPRMDRPDSFNEIVRKSNIAAVLKPKKIILAGLTDKTLKAFMDKIPPNKIIIINSILDIEMQLKQHMSLFDFGEVTCKESDLLKGLLLAKHKNFLLKIDEKADFISEERLNELPKSKHKIVLDTLDELAPIIAINYSFAIGAEVVVIPTPTDSEIKISYTDIVEARALNIVRANRSLISQKSKYTAYLPKISKETGFVTFITKGIPYGYFFPEIPSTHLFSYPDLGLAIFNGIHYAAKQKGTKAALVIDPGFFKDSETELVSKKLQRMGVYVKELKGTEAKVYNVEQHLQFYPYDFLFICSHAGEMKGNELHIKFQDKDGKDHEIVIQEGLSYGLTGKGEGSQAEIVSQHFIGFISIDGVDWDDKQSKKDIKAGESVKDFLKIPRPEWDIVSSQEVIVSKCVVIKLTDHYLQPMFSLLADHLCPIIFNNACVSFYEFSGRLMFAGARAYIGTLTGVNTDEAKSIAEYVFTNISSDKPLPVLLWEAQKQVYRDPKRRVYVHLGASFTNITPPLVDAREYLENRQLESLKRWVMRLDREIKPGVYKNSLSAINFITNTLKELALKEPITGINLD